MDGAIGFGAAALDGATGVGAAALGGGRQAEGRQAAGRQAGVEAMVEVRPHLEAEVRARVEAGVEARVEVRPHPGRQAAAAGVEERVEVRPHPGQQAAGARAARAEVRPRPMRCCRTTASLRSSSLGLVATSARTAPWSRGPRWWRRPRRSVQQHMYTHTALRCSAPCCFGCAALHFAALHRVCCSAFRCSARCQRQRAERGKRRA